MVNEAICTALPACTAKGTVAYTNEPSVFAVVAVMATVPWATAVTSPGVVAHETGTTGEVVATALQTVAINGLLELQVTVFVKFCVTGACENVPTAVSWLV
jgi:hypothetical protein